MQKANKKVKAAIIVIGNPPITSCHPTRESVEILHSKFFCTTVPAPQPIADATIKITPAGADFSIPNSPDSNTPKPLIPRTRPIILAGEDFSPINKILKITAQRGMV